MADFLRDAAHIHTGTPQSPLTTLSGGLHIVKEGDFCPVLGRFFGGGQTSTTSTNDDQIIGIVGIGMTAAIGPGLCPAEGDRRHGRSGKKTLFESGRLQAKPSVGRRTLKEENGDDGVSAEAPEINRENGIRSQLLRRLRDVLCCRGLGPPKAANAVKNHAKQEKEQSVNECTRNT